MEEKELPSAKNALMAAQDETLIKDVTMKEIEEVVQELRANKVPKPHGFRAFFFHKFWHIVLLEVIDTIKHIFYTIYMPRCWKRIFIVLIPNTSNPMRGNDYRPISFCNTVYKLVAKILANKLNPTLLSLVSIEQEAFVPGQSIVDNILVGQKVIHFLMRSPRTHRLMALKIDMKKHMIEYISLISSKYCNNLVFIFDL